MAKPKRKPGRNISEDERNTVRVSLRLAPEVAGLLRAQAEKADMPVSDFVARMLSRLVSGALKIGFEVDL